MVFCVDGLLDKRLVERNAVDLQNIISLYHLRLCRSMYMYGHTYMYKPSALCLEYRIYNHIIYLERNLRYIVHVIDA